MQSGIEGRRNDVQPFDLQPGDYGLSLSGTWYGVPPGRPDLIANLTRHHVEEHDDGTITVEPSILVDRDGERWHGYLKRGAWIELD